ncbi:MAG: RagB/SusD family nutrient uptake outer membrane protein [Bacteroidetes bacterium]|nr:RagB/SusD family nutrient uptake outer membrane protein [Bacteroidota bacterium]MBL6943460.1 RagB/SusD family nutrient uptake outer membrane protein [Bacteroidales bacterium]
MKRYTIKLLITVVSFFILAACTKDFLDVKPEGQITPEGYYSTPERAKELVNSIYNNMLQWDEHSFSWIGMTSITSDDADKGSTPGDTGADKDKMENFTYVPTDISIGEIWVANFRGITRANLALDVLPGIVIEQSLKNRLMGEARFLRAYFYWNLVRCYGGVPLIDKVIDPTNTEQVNQAMIRASVEQIYELIISDLMYAKDSLYSKSQYETSDMGRATTGAATGLLAKVYLYQKNWQASFDMAENVINSGQYALVSDYSTIWREIGENSSESLFEVQAVGGPIALGVQQYTVVQGVRGQFGWGFNSPSDSLNNAYEEGDPRREATMIYPGEVMWDDEIIITNTPNPRYNQKAYVSRTQETFNGNDEQTNKDLRVLRYAEILLIDAEAANELGNVAGALQSLNQVRQRVGLSDITVTDQSQLRQIIWHERRVELGMEHDRFFDLVRQGRAAEVLGPLGFIAGKNEVFPVPQSQIDISGGLLLQNPNY